MNRLGQSAATSLQHEMLTYQMRWQSYGWYSIVIEGNSVEHIVKAFDEAASIKGRPVMILAKTYKGAGILIFTCLHFCCLMIKILFVLLV